MENLRFIMQWLEKIWKKKSLPTVTFATSVWEKDWRQVLLSPNYLPICQIQNHRFAFQEKLLVINNVQDLSLVKKVAADLVERKILSRFVVADEIASEALSFFQLKKSDFQVGADADRYENVNPDWIYYNALAPLTAIYTCKSDYLLYLTGDVRLDTPFDWITPALKKMEKEPNYKVANPTWNGRYDEAKQESNRKEGLFYVASRGFSDQIFLVEKEAFCQPIYGEIRLDASHFPRGDVFEKRVFSHLLNRGYERLIYCKGSYTHQNF